MTISLARYQELLKLPIAAFNGLNNPDEANRFACTDIWTQTQREDLLMFLQTAEGIRQNELGYALSEDVVVNERHDLDRLNPLVLQHKFVHAIGLQTIDLIQNAAITLRPLGLFTDNITISVPVTFTDANEVVVYHAGTDIEITPKKKSIAGGVATIIIPRARLVDPDLLDDREDPLSYKDDNNFVTTVDVKHKWVDVSKGVKYSWRTSKDAFTETTAAGYGDLVDPRLGVVNIFPATFVGQTPTPTFLSGCVYGTRYVQISYVAGRCESIMDLYTVRLAHTLMPNSPSLCEAVFQYWQNDYDPPKDSYSVTPYGRGSGALDTWMFDSRQKIGFGGMVKR